MAIHEPTPIPAPMSDVRAVIESAVSTCRICK